MSGLPFVSAKIVQLDEPNEAFLHLPEALAKGYPHWEPEAPEIEKELLTPKGNPFYAEAERTLFVAYHGDQVVGRIAIILNQVHNRQWKCQDAFFGFIDVVDQLETTEILLQAASAWAMLKGANRLLGPVNPSTNYTTGVLVEGFDRPSGITMAYNPPYYLEHLECLGFTKLKDYLSYHLEPIPSSEALAKALRAAPTLGITFKSIGFDELDRWYEPLRAIYNDSFDGEWGFLPMGPEEFRCVMSGMKPHWKKNLAIVAEFNGEPVGFASAFVKKGRPENCHFMYHCVKRAVRSHHIGLMLVSTLLRAAIDAGYQTMEGGFVSESNHHMRRLIERVAQPTKRYRILGKELGN